MNDGIKYFEEFNPSLANYWRSIILFGRNVASYKFALAKSLIELSQNNKTRISLEELAVQYSHYRILGKFSSHAVSTRRHLASASSKRSSPEISPVWGCTPVCVSKLKRFVFIL